MNKTHQVTKVFTTIDTELSLRLFQDGVSVTKNFESSIIGRCKQGDFGIHFLMDIMDEYDQKVVFFVDPMPALVYGQQLISDIVGPIVERGHDVQLHIHTEWLKWVKNSPVHGATGRDIADFNLVEQLILLECAHDILVSAGAPEPIAFRAGNYGANDDTLRALRSLRYLFDTSFNAQYLGISCHIDLPTDQMLPIVKQDIVEIPVAVLEQLPGNFRHIQVCAVSKREIIDVLQYAAVMRIPFQSIVCHSFEMLSRNRKRANRTVVERYKTLARTVALNDDLQMVSFVDVKNEAIKFRLEGGEKNIKPMKYSYSRTGVRYLQQAISTALYERS